MNNLALQQAVKVAVKRKFHGHTTLKSKISQHYPQSAEREYMRVTDRYMALLNRCIAEELPNIKQALNAGYALRLDSDIDDIRQGLKSVEQVINDTFSKILIRFNEQSELFNLTSKLDKIENLTVKLSVSEWKNVVKQTLGIDILGDYYNGEFWVNILPLWTQNNVDLIATIPKQTLTKMNNIVLDGFYSGKLAKDIGKEIQQTYGVEKRHARFIARDQIAKLNAQITQQQHADAGVTEYVWSTSGDERVRHSHSELDGTRQNYAQPPVVGKGRRCNPGEDYQCRCVALPVFDYENLSLPWLGDENNSNLGLTNGFYGGIISSMNTNNSYTGASVAIPRSNLGAMDKHAVLFYEEARKRTTDIEKIFENLKTILNNINFTLQDIKNIKQHVFFNEYDLGKKKATRFDPDYDMAVSWQRLTDGKDIKEMDVVLLHHELTEYRLMKDGMDYSTAHEIAENKYNYSKFIKELNDREGIK